MADDDSTASPRLFAEYRPGESAKETSLVQAVYRDAGAADAERIARIVARREGFAFEQAMARVTRWLSLDADANCMIVAGIESQVVGYGRAGLMRVESVPQGWYLTGVVVDEAFRRRGIGMQLTQRRMDWIRRRGAAEGFYFVNSGNLASIDLHRDLGFEEIQRPFCFPGCTFTDGVGVLFRADLATT